MNKLQALCNEQAIKSLPTIDLIIRYCASAAKAQQMRHEVIDTINNFTDIIPLFMMSKCEKDRLELALIDIFKSKQWL